VAETLSDLVVRKRYGYDRRVGDIKRTAQAWVLDHREELSGWTRTIWELAEPAWREYRSAAWYVDRLRAEGFELEVGSGDMPTAFSATWSNGDGPVLLTYAEYDAVPGNSQAATTQRAPRPGTSPFAPGHTDPHSALGIATFAGLLATKAAMERHGVRGTLRYTGEPAEKVQGSKVVHGLRGYYDGADAILSFHPFYMLPLCNTVRWDTHCGAYYSLVYSFVAREEPWSPAASDSAIPAAHTSARAPGANVALSTMLGLTKATQESMLPHVGGWSLNEAILSAGHATADNLPAQLAQIQYAWRVPDVAMADTVLAVLDANAEHAAASAHCDLVRTWVARNRPGLANHALAEAVWDNLRAVGAPRYGADAVDVARRIQAELGFEPVERPFLEACEQLVDPLEAEAQLRALMPAWQRHWTSDDYVEMTWYAPTARFYVARPVLRPPTEGGAYPSWVMNALGGIPATIDPTTVCAASTIAGTLVDLLTQPRLLAAAREEFENRRADEPHREPLLPPDHRPPTDLPWPEYVTTARGTGWVNPFGSR
jgi:aminobenzoyl-glutamate utilization protein B